MKKYLRVFWLPLLLIILLAIQTSAFDYWNRLSLDWQARSTIATLGLGVFVFGISVLMSYRWRHLYLLLVSTITGLIFISQYLYFSYSGGFLQASALSYVGQVSMLGGTIKTLLSPHIILFVLGIPLIILSFISSDKKKSARLYFTGKTKLITLAILLLLPAASYSYVAWREDQEVGDIKGLYSRLYNIQELIAKIGIVNYFLEDSVRVALASNTVTPQDKTLVTEYLKQQTVNVPNANFGLAKGRNLILIQVESLENFTINRTIDGQAITPNLNSLIGHSLYFPNYYYQAGPGTTADAEFSVENSLYPLTGSVAFFNNPNDHYRAMPSLLKDSGYNTAVLHGDTASFWNRNNVYPNLGYTHIFSNIDFSMSRLVNLGLSAEEGIGDEEFLIQAANKLKTLQQPFAATAITLTSHTPFDIPDDLKTLKITNQEGLSDYQIKYLQSIHYTDRSIGEFINKLKSLGLYDNSVIAIYGDHKSFISTIDDTNFAHFLGLSQFDQLSYLENSQVPLFIIAPNLNLTGTKTQPVSHLDLYPTLANLLGIPVPPTVLGQDILTSIHPVVTQRQDNSISDIITPQLTYLASGNGTFIQGKCLDSNHKPLAIEQCHDLYNQQKNIVHVSDLMVKGDLFTTPSQ